MLGKTDNNTIIFSPVGSGEIISLDYLPYDLTYPLIQPKLYRYVCDNVLFNPKTEKKRMIAGKLYFQPVPDFLPEHP